MFTKACQQLRESRSFQTGIFDMIPSENFSPSRNPSRSTWWPAIWHMLLVLLALSSGCDRSDSPIVPTSGLILFHGLPARANIIAQPLGKNGEPIGRPSVADTREDGTFSLSYNEQQMGTALGLNRVTIRLFPMEREEGELGFQTRFKALKEVVFQRETVANRPNHWEFYLTY